MADARAASSPAHIDDNACLFGTSHKPAAIRAQRLARIDVAAPFKPASLQRARRCFLYPFTTTFGRCHA
jgi:hypothetical protein